LGQDYCSTYVVGTKLKLKQETCKKTIVFVSAAVVKFLVLAFSSEYLEMYNYTTVCQPIHALTNLCLCIVIEYSLKTACHRILVSYYLTNPY
jgi:hypothetical protein